MLPIRLTSQARRAITRRGISEGEVDAVVKSPEQEIPLSLGRVLVQSITAGPHQPLRLLAVIVQTCPEAIEVVTAFRTDSLRDSWIGLH